MKVACGEFFLNENNPTTLTPYFNPTYQEGKRLLWAIYEILYNLYFGHHASMNDSSFEKMKANTYSKRGSILSIKLDAGRIQCKDTKRQHQNNEFYSG